MAAPAYEYQAVDTIVINGEVAFRPGDLVPAEHVERYALLGGVHKRDVPEGAQGPSVPGEGVDDLEPNGE